MYNTSMKMNVIKIFENIIGILNSWSSTLPTSCAGVTPLAPPEKLLNHQADEPWKQAAQVYSTQLRYCHPEQVVDSHWKAIWREGDTPRSLSSDLCSCVTRLACSLEQRVLFVKVARGFTLRLPMIAQEHRQYLATFQSGADLVL